jgi:5-methylcytosine-specific restriction endonuclease McrA
VRPSHALLLNADYTPIKVISWERAVGLLFKDRVDVVVEYARSVLHSIGTSQPWPAVIRLRRYVSARARIRFNRSNVLARDNYTCAYCGKMPMRGGKPDVADLTLDHVVPRAQSRAGMVTTPHGTLPVTCWENIVSACADCNSKKSDKTPVQAGMVLRFQPRAPSPVDVLRIHMRRVSIPQEWADYLPAGASGWRGYWTDELDPA